MKDKTTKRRGVAAKLIPATCMLLVSATALVSSTYAWFTMSREVEVQNIKLTASVPEDLQISLGKLDTVAGSGNGYMNNYGKLVKASGNNANNGRVDAPGDTAEYWANTVDVSKYYMLGTIMPASSTDGQDVFFTPDAAGVGKTLKTGAKYYTAVDNSTTKSDNTGTPGDGKEYTQTYETTLHAITGKSNDTVNDNWTPDLATAYNLTNDAGYYVDIPVWIRSGAKEATALSVDAYVTTSNKKDTDDLYLAARAVILNSDKSSTSKLIEIKEDNYSSLKSVVDFMNTTNANGEAVQSIPTEGSTAPVYGTQSHYDGSLMSSLFTVPAAGNNNYGEAVKVWVRVWLEGEDPNCWNDNAGQNFNISLKFSKDALVQNTGTIESPSEGANYPKANTFTAINNDTNNSVMAGDTVTVKYTGNADMIYTYNGTAWERTFGSYPEGAITYNSTVYADESAFVGALKTSVTKKSQLSSDITITDANTGNWTLTKTADGFTASKGGLTALPNNSTKYTYKIEPGTAGTYAEVVTAWLNSATTDTTETVTVAIK